MTMTAVTDRRWPFCVPSWLSFSRQNPYSNLNESLMKAIHIWNLEEIRLKNDKKVRVTTTADTDRWQPFCRPSWLWFVGQNLYSILNEFEGSHPYMKFGRNLIKNDQDNGWTDKPKTIELRQHLLTPGP